jgi:hypothetical protein
MAVSAQEIPSMPLSPSNEAERLAALARYGVLDTAAELARTRRSSWSRPMPATWCVSSTRA